MKDPSIQHHTMRLNFGSILDAQKANPGTSFEKNLRALTLHEFGHAIGLIHEHLRPKMGDVFVSEAEVLAYYDTTFKWSAKTTRENVLERYAASQLHESKDEIGVDFSSIMMYAPAGILKSKKEIPYVYDLSQHDKDFVKEIYGK